MTEQVNRIRREADRMTLEGALHEEAARARAALWRRRVEHEREMERRSKARKLRVKDRVERSRLPEYVLRAVGLWNRGCRNALRLRVSRKRFLYANLPEPLQGLRILHLTDIHFNRAVPEFAEILRDTIAAVECDLCVMTGDYQFSHIDEAVDVSSSMETVLSGIKARHEVLAVLGNHDVSGFVEAFRKLGIRMLMNEHTSVEHNGCLFYVAGVDDPHRFRCADLDLATEGIPEDAFTLLLAHTPELATAAPRYGIDLYLCGHTHWGQVRLPVLGAVFLNARCPAQYCEGVWRNGRTQGYTSAGAGTTDMPVRFNCPPEVCLIELCAG